MFEMKVETHNAAFAENLTGELASILRKVADQIEAGELSGRSIRDSNGNSVGYYKTTEQ